MAGQQSVSVKYPKPPPPSQTPKKTRSSWTVRKRNRQIPRFQKLWKQSAYSAPARCAYRGQRRGRGEACVPPPYAPPPPPNMYTVRGKDPRQWLKRLRATPARALCRSLRHTLFPGGVGGGGGAPLPFATGGALCGAPLVVLKLSKQHVPRFRPGRCSPEGGGGGVPFWDDILIYPLVRRDALPTHDESLTRDDTTDTPQEQARANRPEALPKAPCGWGGVVGGWHNHDSTATVRKSLRCYVQDAYTYEHKGDS